MRTADVHSPGDPGAGAATLVDERQPAVDLGAAPPAPSPPLSRTEAPRPQERSRSWTSVAMGVRILGALGFVAGAAGGGIVANYYGFSGREVALVAGLLGLFGASLGAIIPPLTKAIGWLLLCAGIAAIGIGSLRLLGLLVPEFLERFLG